ncbi:hypothetical protein R1sor_014458 [Riccia sorocarpa]|uniref:Reverse transcriptase zinc-binding domain-containing protein n=1 Tax=Riccia sorocarpa TaxID=122646 RepID=A0ABD3HDB4_9MARC
MLSGWCAGKQNLKMVRGKGRLPPDTEVEVVIRIGEVQLGSKHKEWLAIKRRLKMMRVTKLRELSEWMGAENDQIVQLADPLRWSWDPDDTKPRTTWNRSIQEWKKELQPEYKLREKMNASWGLSWDTKKWMDLRRGLWKACLAPRDKIWLWKILNKGFFTLECSATMEIGSPTCTRCGNGTENIKHMFLFCKRTAITWNHLDDVYKRNTGKGMQGTSLPSLLEYSVKPENIAVLILLAFHTRYTWKDRCKKVYEGRDNPTPPTVILQEVEKAATSLAKKYTSKVKLESIKAGRRELALIKRTQTIDKIRRDRRIFAAQLPLTHTMWQETPEPPDSYEDRNTNREDAQEGHQPKEHDNSEESSPPTHED